MGKSRILATNSQSYAQNYLLELKQELGISEHDLPDFLLVQPRERMSIAIEQTRELIRWSQLKPFSAPNKLGVVLEAELLTIEAQNSLLKLLEEPNDLTTLLLITSHYRSLLPTILSRCEIIEVQSIADAPGQDYAKLQLLDQLAYLEKVLGEKNKIEQSALVTSLLLQLLQNNREELFHGSDTNKSLYNIDLIHETLYMLSKNISTRLALENLLVNLQQ